MVKKVLNLPTNDSKVYKQLLAFLNFSLEASPQEREVLAEIIQLNNEYEALPVKQRAKFILSTDMRKDMRKKLDIKEVQFNVLIGRLKSKTLFGKPLFDENNILNPFLHIKADNEGIRIEINLVNTVAKETSPPPVVEEKKIELIKENAVDIPNTSKKLAKDAGGTDNIIEDELPSGFVILPPNGE